MRWAVMTLVLATGVAHADGDPFEKADPRDLRASRLFVDGRTLLAAGDEAAACDRFERSLAAEHAPGTAMNLAVCMEHRGRLGEALQLFEDAATQLRAAGADERAQFAQARADALVPQVATVIVHMTDAPEGVTIQIDNRRIDAETHTRVTPGLVSIVARTRDGRQSRGVVQAVATQTHVVNLPAFSAPIEPPDKPPRDAAVVGLAGIVASAGVMSLAFGLAASEATYIAAGVMLNGVGLVIFMAAPREPAFVTPTVTSTSVGLSVSGRF